jgi:hypothetical protein
MRGVVLAKMLGLGLVGLYLAIGLTQPPTTESKQVDSRSRMVAPSGEHRSNEICSALVPQQPSKRSLSVHPSGQKERVSLPRHSST